MDSETKPAQSRTTRGIPPRGFAFVRLDEVFSEEANGLITIKNYETERPTDRNLTDFPNAGIELVSTQGD